MSTAPKVEGFPGHYSELKVLGFWDCDISNMTSFSKFGKCLLWQSDICEMEPSLCPAAERTISGRFPGGEVLLGKHLLELLENVWRGHHTLLVIYYLLSTWPAVWPPLLVLGREEDSTPAFISGNGKKYFFGNSWEGLVYHFSGWLRTPVVADKNIKSWQQL